MVFLISDFQDESYTKELSVFAHRHDLIACRITDPAEEALPNVGLVELADPETHQTLLVDTADASLRKAFADRARARRAEQESIFRRTGIDLLDLSTDKPYVNAVRTLFRKRALRRH